MGERQGDFILFAVAIERHCAFGNGPAAKCPAFPAFGRACQRFISSADRYRQAGSTAARKEAYEQIKRHILGPHERFLWARNRRAHRGEAVFIDAEGLFGTDPPIAGLILLSRRIIFVGRCIAGNKGQAIITLRRAGGGDPFTFANAIGINRHGNSKFGIGACVG